MKTVPELQQEIQTLQNQIGEIQKNCSHPNYEVVMYSWRPGAYAPSRVCTTCRVWLPDIDQEEERECWDGWHKNFAQVGEYYESQD